MRIWNIIIINILTHILEHSSQSTWLVRKWKQSEPCQVFRVSYSGLDSRFILMPMQTSNSSLSSVYLLMTVLCFLIDLRWWIPSRCYGFTCWSWRRWMTCVKISAAATSPASRPRWTARRCSAASQEAPTPQHRHRYTRKHPRNLSLSNNALHIFSSQPLSSFSGAMMSPQGIVVPASALQQGNVTVTAVNPTQVVTGLLIVLLLLSDSVFFLVLSSRRIMTVWVCVFNPGGTVYQPVTVVTPRGQLVTQTLSPGTIRIQNSQVRRRQQTHSSHATFRVSLMCWFNYSSS